MKYPLIWFLKAYRLLISPLYGQVCRYYPSCSAYALESVTRYGAVKGCWLAVRRIVCCHPWAAGGYDPVPTEFRWRKPPESATSSPSSSSSPSASSAHVSKELL
ncbi:MAG: membrane protein insertion efficiency factor YidD [Nocardioidaceae bacterium]